MKKAILIVQIITGVFPCWMSLAKFMYLVSIGSLHFTLMSMKLLEALWLMPRILSAQSVFFYFSTSIEREAPWSSG